MSCEIGNAITILKNAERLGSQEDKPEGSRYIMLSDTLVSAMIADLETVLEQSIHSQKQVDILEVTNEH